MNPIVFPLPHKIKQPLIGAHRGASGYAPENTLAAIKKGIELKADYIEVDVHLTKDKEAVVIHNDRLERTTNGRGFVGDKTWSELKKLDAGSWFDQKFAAEKIPLLEEVLSLVRETMTLLLLEFKAPLPIRNLPPYSGLAEHSLKLVHKFGLQERVFYLSFEHGYLKKIKDLDPEAATIAIYGGMTPVSPLLIARDCQADGISLYADWVSQELVKLAHSQGLWITGWTASQDPFPETITALVDNGVDFLDTAYPDKTRELIQSGVKS